MTGSVRWEESVQTLVALGVDEAYEVGPGKVLEGLCKRIAPIDGKMRGALQHEAASTSSESRW